MKRIFKLGMLTMLTMLLYTAIAYAEDTTKFTTIQTYNGITYTCIDTFANGQILANDVRSLPQQVHETDMGDIRNFAVYYDKIYYLTGEEGTSDILGYIYRCNLDGSNIELIANNADAISTPYLSDGCLYYTVYTDYNNWYGRGHNGGIMKINLNTGEYGKIVTDRDAYLENVLGDNVFYYASDYHLMKTNGRYVGSIAKDDIEISANIIVGNKAYKCFGYEIYTLDWNGNKKWVGSPVRTVDGHSAISQCYCVENVTGGYIYYEVGTGIYYKDNVMVDVAMYRMPVGGGKSYPVAIWFKP